MHQGRQRHAWTQGKLHDKWRKTSAAAGVIVADPLSHPRRGSEGKGMTRASGPPSRTGPSSRSNHRHPALVSRRMPPIQPSGHLQMDASRMTTSHDRGRKRHHRLSQAQHGLSSLVHRGGDPGTRVPQGARAFLHLRWGRGWVPRDVPWAAMTSSRCSGVPRECVRSSRRKGALGPHHETLNLRLCLCKT